MASAKISLLARRTVGSEFNVLSTQVVEIGQDGAIVTPDTSNAPRGHELAIEIEASRALLYAVANFAGTPLTGAHSTSETRAVRAAFHPGGHLAVCQIGVSPLAALTAAFEPAPTA